MQADDCPLYWTYRMDSEGWQIEVRPKYLPEGISTPVAMVRLPAESTLTDVGRVGTALFTLECVKREYTQL